MDGSAPPAHFPGWEWDAGFPDPASTAPGWQGAAAADALFPSETQSYEGGWTSFFERFSWSFRMYFWRANTARQLFAPLL